jgi:hypothetical protein
MIKDKSGDFVWKAHGKHRLRDESNKEWQKDGVFHSGGFEYSYKDAKFTLRKATDPEFKGTFEYNAKDFLPGLKVKGELLAKMGMDEKKEGDIVVDKKSTGVIERSGSGTLEYSSNDASAKLQITSEGAAKASVTVMNDGKFGFGLDGCYSTEKSRFTAYNAAFWMAFDQSTLCVKHMSDNKKEYELGSLVNSYHRKLENGEIGGLIKTKVADYSTTMEFAGAYKPWEDAEFRGKFNSKGEVGLSWG